MFITLLSILLLSLCYLTYIYAELDKCEAERQTLIASIAKLRTASLDNKQLYR